MNKYNAYLYLDVTMKKLQLFCLLTLIFISNFSTTFAQLGIGNSITFDAGDTLWPYVIKIDTVNYHHNQWQVGRPQKKVFDSAHSLANALVTDTANVYAPNDTSVFFIGLPIGLPPIWQTHAALDEFYFIYKLNTDSSSFATIEFSRDSGKSWISLPDSTRWGVEGDTLVYNDSSKWHYWHFNTGLLYSYEYNSYRTDSLIFKFLFVSGNDTMSKDGWMIDDIHVEYYGEGVNEVQKEKLITIYPNPANDWLNLVSHDLITSISISNMVGQVIYEHRYSTKNVQVNTSDFPPGMYFLKVNNSTIEKFVKQ